MSRSLALLLLPTRLWQNLRTTNVLGTASSKYADERGHPLDREGSRIVTSLLFGAMNWFYTWYEPTRDYEQRTRIMDEVFRMVAGSIANH